MSIFYSLSETFFNFLLELLTHLIYRVKSINTSIVPESGPVLLTPNHMSFVDGLILQYSIPHRKIRFVVYKNYFDWPIMGWFLKLGGCIPISETRSKDAIVQVVGALEKGEAVCIFPEGSMTRIGHLLPFKRGVELILKRAPEDTVVIPVYFDKLWGSIFSFKGGKYFWKLPEKLPYPMTLLFGKPLTKNIPAYKLRQKVSELGAEAFSMRKNEFKTLPAHFIETAKRFLFKKSVADISEKPLTYLRLLANSVLLSKEVQARCPNEKTIGLVFPPSVSGVLANIAVGLSGKIAVNLNFATDEDSLTKSLAACEIKTVLTSDLTPLPSFLQEKKEQTPFTGSERRWEKSNLQLIYIEDLMKNFNSTRKIIVFLSIVFLPAFLLRALYYKTVASSEDMATIIFSRGSTGESKAVMLSHANIISNGEMVSQVVQFRSNDRMLGVLSFFYAMGYTLTLWFPLLKGLFTIYNPDPLDAEKVGQLAEKYQCTFLLGTPLLYDGYIQKCTRKQFQHLRLAMSGADKLTESMVKAFTEKFGVPLLEGYGVTEMSPVISCNVPDYSGKDLVQIGTKPGSVGLALPGISVKIVNPENYDEEFPPGQTGMLLVNGPNRMLGYLNDKKQTEEILHKGWYITGDLAKLDEEGFIYLAGKASRFDTEA